jgi:ribonuclease P protein component
LAQSARKRVRSELRRADADLEGSLRILNRPPPGPNSHETHVSAKEAQARPHSWVPCSDEHARRPPDAEAAPGKGPQATHGLMDARTTGLPGGGRLRSGSRRGRLTRSADFDRVFRQGRSQAGRELVLYVFPRGGDDGVPRLGLSVSRKVGSAVERNKVKRLVREAFSSGALALAPGMDAVVVARPDARALAEREGLAGISRVLGELLARAGAIDEPHEEAS